MVDDSPTFFGNLTFRVHMERLAEEEVIDDPTFVSSDLTSSQCLQPPKLQVCNM
jgi:hypothetical protein